MKELKIKIQNWWRVKLNNGNLKGGFLTARVYG